MEVRYNFVVSQHLKSSPHPSGVQIPKTIAKHNCMTLYMCTCVTLTPYIKGPPGTLYCIKALLAGIYLSARPLTRESYDRYTLLRKPSLLPGKKSCPNTIRMGDKALALGCYAPSGLVLCCPYIPIGHDLCNTCTVHTSCMKVYQSGLWCSAWQLYAHTV